MKEIFEPLPKKKYSIIYADPAWTYKDKAQAGKRGACFKYPVLTIEEICSLPVKEIAAENSILFIWTTFPKIFESKAVMDAWGFEYKTVAFIWVKKNKIKDSLFMGMGKYTRANAEVCLLTTKGRIKRIDASVHSVIISRIQKHSKKPQEARERIVQLVGDLTRIELFSREKIPGWDCWGNEIKMN